MVREDSWLNGADNQVAIIVGKQSLTYRELRQQIKQKQSSTTADYQIIQAKNTLEFVIELLSLIFQGVVPVIANDLTQKDFLLAHKRKIAQTLQAKSNQEVLFVGATSGTTGKAKIFLRSWPSWQAGFDACQRIFRVCDYSVIATASPFSTSIGLHTLFLSMYFGKTLIFLTKDYPIRIKEKTMYFLVPTYLKQNYRQLAFFPRSCIVLGGGVLTDDDVRQLRKHLPTVSLYEYYGSSETSFIAWQELDGDKEEGCVGRLFPKVKVTVINQRLIVTSPYLFSGYLGEATPQQVEPDDYGKLIGDRLYLRGRKQDLIDHAGNKVYPQEVEQVLQTLVDDVAVFGIPDVVYGQKIVAAIVTAKTVDQVKKDLQGKLAKYKIPQEYIKLTAIPINRQTNKRSRKLLSDLYRKGCLNEITTQSSHY